MKDYAALTTEALIDMFRSAARQYGMGRSQLAALDNLRDPLASPLTNDLKGRKPAFDQIWALSLVLCDRRPISEIEQLLEDSDPDIRATAAGFLAQLSPELADAAAKGFQVKRPTREILALQRRARQAPPPQPSLEDMSDDELVARFEDATLRESGVYLLNYLEDAAIQDLRNNICGEVWDVMRQLKARGLLAKLLPLLASDNLTVRREAAVACLRIAEPEAVAALESVSRDGVFGDNFSARIALADWREKGRVVYGL